MRFFKFGFCVLLVGSLVQTAAIVRITKALRAANNTIEEMQEDTVPTCDALETKAWTQHMWKPMCITSKDTFLYMLTAYMKQGPKCGRSEMEKYERRRGQWEFVGCAFEQPAIVISEPASIP